MKNIVITGVSTGIGYGTTSEFIKSGYRVFGSVRRQEDADRLKAEFGPAFYPLLFDLTDHKAIPEAAAVVKREIGEEGLSGLINNAGAAEGGPLMHVPVEIFKKHLDLLVTGQLVVTQAFLPLLGADRSVTFNPGRIIFISSVSGQVGFPFNGSYVAAKHAVEGLSKALRVELMIYGIDVIVVGPGNVKTPIWDKQTGDAVEKYRETDYYEALKGMNSWLKEYVPADSVDLDLFCRRLRRIFETRRPKQRYTIVKSRIKNQAIRMMPARLRDRIFARYAGLR